MVREESVVRWMNAFYTTVKHEPFAYDRLKHSFTLSQVQSKNWIRDQLDELGVYTESCGVIGGWFCHYLTEILLEFTEEITNYETDPYASSISKRFNSHNKGFCSEHRDIFLKGFSKDHELIINTSCEHMFNMEPIVRKYPEMLYVLQSTDETKYRDHINTVKSPEELIEQAGLTHVSYSGTKVLDNGMNRFMVIGRR